MKTFEEMLLENALIQWFSIVFSLRTRFLILNISGTPTMLRAGNVKDGIFYRPMYIPPLAFIKLSAESSLVRLSSILCLFTALFKSTRGKRRPYLKHLLFLLHTCKSVEKD